MVVVFLFFVENGFSQSHYPAATITSIDKEIITPRSLKGKIVMLHFWFIGCAPCLKEIPDLSKLQAKYANDSRVKFIAISVNDTSDKIKQFLKNKTFSFVHIPKLTSSRNLLFNPQPDWPTFYKVNRYPTSIILGPSGKVVTRTEDIPKSSYLYYDKIIQSLLR